MAHNGNNRSLRFFISTTAVSALLALSACSSVSTSDGNSQRASTPASAAVSASVAQTNYQFASAEQAGSILAREDEYTAGLQALEIGIKNQDPTKDNFTDLQENYRAGTLEWSADEQAALTAVIDALRDDLAAYQRHLPSEVLLGKISDRVEGGLPHTRANMILFSQRALDSLKAGNADSASSAVDGLKSLFLHELHHVMSRRNATHHDDYFALIGFEPCDFVEPADLRAIRLSNPDAPTYKHFAPTAIANDQITADGVIPYLSASGAYDPASGTGLGDYFNFGLLAVNVDDGQCSVAGQTPTFLSPGQVPAFFGLIGQNTGYIIHPEETLADNFTYLVMDKQGLPNPEIPQKIGAFWAGLE